MPTFDPDFDNVQASTRIFEKGLYLIKIKKVIGTAFKQNEDAKSPSMVDIDGELLSVGARAFMEMVGKYDSRGNLVEDDTKGEEVADNTFWLHNRGSMKMTKQALMGIFGYGEDEEKKFNEWYKDQNFGYSVDRADDDEDKFVVELNEGWTLLEGREVVVFLEKGAYENKKKGETTAQQKFKNWGKVVNKPKAVA